MKKLFLVAAAAFLAVPAFCTTGESAAFTFRSVTEAAKTPELQPADPVYYSSDLAEGTPVSVTITVQDVNEPSRQATLFSDTTGSAVKGNYYWDYTQSPYSSWPSSHTYQLTETVVSSSETKSFYHNVTIAPEPIGFLLLGVAGFLFFRKRAKSLAAVIIAMTVLGTFSAKAECTVAVAGTQFYPLSRMVIIDYTLSSASATKFSVDFSCTCSDDDWATTYKLSDYGTLSGEGADGTVNGTGSHTIYWTPGSAFDNKDVSMKVQVNAEEIPPLYKVFDLNNGSVENLDAVPSGGWTDAHKTTKLVMRYIAPGTFLMGSPADFSMRGDTDLYQHEVTLTKPYYIGVFEVTQAQYELITGTNPSQTQGATRPLEGVNFNTITGANGFFQLLNAKTGLTFGLPTEAQWEMACRAGTETSLNNGTDIQTNDWDPNLAQLGRYTGDSRDNNPTQDYNECHTVVGSYLPNAWGLYDMHGNVYEWCLDYIDNSHLKNTDPTVDEVGTLTGNYATIRGGSWGAVGKACCSASRNYGTKNMASSNRMSGRTGFRVFMQLD